MPYVAGRKPGRILSRFGAFNPLDPDAGAATLRGQDAGSRDTRGPGRAGPPAPRREGTRPGFRIATLGAVSPRRRLTPLEAQQFPMIGAALLHLDRAMDEQMPRWPQRKRLRDERRARNIGRTTTAKMKNLRSQRWRLQKKVRALEAALERFLGPQGEARAALPVTLLTHVALSYPPASARGFARSAKDLLGSAARPLHRTAVGKIRDAFVGLVQDAGGRGTRARQHELVTDTACGCAGAYGN